ncbi:MAG TPA: phosphate/phosphite/phosphonate ABC transporter substrate-binding protein [Gallionellaceae bacterium]|nr:phosphate/phosphite/phosphonate ABC transporter substrate-binding protein [Gallionellaceae bacterium]
MMQQMPVDFLHSNCNMRRFNEAVLNAARDLMQRTSCPTQAGGFKRLGLVCISCALLAFGKDGRAVETPLVFGIFPYQSNTQLIALCSPLRDYLQQISGRQMEIVSAPDFNSFRDRTRAGEYDIVYTAPHLGRLAEIESGFQRVAITRYRTQSVILVAKDSQVQKLSDLRGKSLAIPPAAAIINMLTIELFHSQGLESGDFKLLEQSNMQNAMAAILRGDCDAGAAGFAPWRSYAQRDQLRVIAKSAEVPGLIIMAHPRVPKAMVAKLRRALIAFNDTAEGKTYFALTNQGAWLPVDDATMLTLDPYLRHARN